MGLRFFKRVKVAPGVTLNLSKSGGSLSFGPRGAKFTVGPRGKRATVGLPGTGLFYTTTFKNKSGQGRNVRENSRGASSGLQGESRGESSGLQGASSGFQGISRPGFLKRLFTSQDEVSLIEGCVELDAGNELKALDHLSKAAHIADAAYLAGLIALKLHRLDQAQSWLSHAVENHLSLGKCFERHDIYPSMELPITEEIAVCITPSLHGVLLGLTEVYQLQEEWEKAMECLEELMEIDAGDIIVKLSAAELIMDAAPDDPESLRQVVSLAEGIENETAAHATLMLYKARALGKLSIYTAARDTLTSALRRKKDRSHDLLLALRYERALVYEALGESSRARSDLEKIYGDSPNYKDVPQRLGLQR
ncbi:MAG: DUF4236 domain-containing protein [Desulfamplus sp.]|nr:DUF4236 domain-containing protein [Desulfamplus sp.]